MPLCLMYMDWNLVFLLECDSLFPPRQPSSSHKLDSVRFVLSIMSTSDIRSLLLLGSDGQHSQVSVSIRMIRILVGDPFSPLFSILAP
jgi:hypothetical protein